MEWSYAVAPDHWVEPETDLIDESVAGQEVGQPHAAVGQRSCVVPSRVATASLCRAEMLMIQISGSVRVVEATHFGIALMSSEYPPHGGHTFKSSWSVSRSWSTASAERRASTVLGVPAYRAIGRSVREQ